MITLSENLFILIKKKKKLPEGWIPSDTPAALFDLFLAKVEEWQTEWIKNLAVSIFFHKILTKPNIKIHFTDIEYTFFLTVVTPSCVTEAFLWCEM